MDRYAADPTVKRLARCAGITKGISPHRNWDPEVIATVLASRDVTA